MLEHKDVCSLYRFKKHTLRRLNRGRFLLAAAAVSLYLSVATATCICTSCRNEEARQNRDITVRDNTQANARSDSKSSIMAKKNGDDAMIRDTQMSTTSEARSSLSSEQNRDDIMVMDNTAVNTSSSDGTSTCSVNGKQVCLTAGCVRAASMLLENVDFEQDPCDNFYEFACGNFIKKTIIPDDALSVSMFTKTIDMLNEQLRIIMEEPMAPDEPKPYKLVKYLYTACMNTSLIEEIGLTKILQILKELGGWPVLEGSAWDDSNFDWKHDIYKFRDYGFSVDYIIKFTIVQDMENTTVRVLQLDQATLGLNSQFLVQGLDEELVQAYYDYMVDVAVFLGANKTKAETELKESLLFEIKLAKIFLSREQRRNMTKLYNPMTIPQLQEKFPSIPWAEYIAKLLPATVTLKPDEIINVVVPRYISRLEVILSVTPERVLANYLKWRVTAASVLYLSVSLRKLRLDYFTILGGINQQQPRWMECVEITSTRLKVVVGSLYVQRFFKQDSKRCVTEIVDAIREEMYEILTEVNWMDEKTRQNALDKAKFMTEFIGYPEELLVTANLEEYYDKLEINPDEYLESVLNITKFEQDYMLSQLRDLYDKSDWRLHAETATVNAGYDFNHNYIEFPAGILQGVFFSNERPMYLNFAAIGCVIGHEVTHAFDDQGSQFGKDGNLINWWDPETKEHYSEKAACIIDQYGNFTLEEVGLKVNGIVTLGENIADNGGLKEANRAYNAWESKYGEEPQLPGFLGYSSQQMFWISAANIWCSKFRPEVLEYQINVDEHAPNEFRVIGPFTNSEEFSKDFNCPPGSKMNPTKKCEVW